MTTLVVAGPTGLAEHDGGSFHPEQPARVFAVMDGVRALELDDEVVYAAVSEASLAELSRVHSPAYLAELEAFCAAAVATSTPTPTPARTRGWPRAAPRGRAWRRWPSSSAGARASASCPSDHPAITPAPTGPWASAW